MADNATERESFSTGSNGDAVGNNYGLLDGGGTTSPAVVTLSNTVAVNGSFSAKFDTGDGTGAAYRVLAPGQTTTCYASGYMYVPSGQANPTTNIPILMFYDVGGSPVNTLQLMFKTDGNIQLRETSTTFRGSALSITKGQWYRVEVGAWGGNTMELRTFTGANLHGSTPDASTSYNALAKTDTDQIRFGANVASGVQFVIYWDAVGYNNSTWAGPIDTGGSTQNTDGTLAVTADRAGNTTGGGTPGAPVLVKQAFNYAGAATTSVTTTLSSAATAGNLIWLVLALDKTSGYVFSPDFTTVRKHDQASVSTYIGYKVANGGETSITVTWETTSATGSSLWVGEFSQGGSGDWRVDVEAFTAATESNVQSVSTGTTPAIKHNGLALAYMTVDSASSISVNPTINNSYNIIHNKQSTSGRAEPMVATKEVTAGTTTSATWSWTGADQASGGVVVFSRNLQSGSQPWTLAWLADFQTTTSWTTAMQEAFDRAVSLNPTLIALGGDLANDGSASAQTIVYNGVSSQINKIVAMAGNHDYLNSGWANYWAQWGSVGYAHGASSSAPWYSFDINNWHVMVLFVAPGSPASSAGSAQYIWASADLAANVGKPTIAMWHEARFSIDGNHQDADEADLNDLWALLMQYKVELIINGHVHMQQRFPPVNNTGAYDIDGPMEFTASGIVWRSILDGYKSDAQYDWYETSLDGKAVLFFTFRDTGYTWEFRDVGTAGQVLHSGSRGSYYVAGAGGGEPLPERELLGNLPTGTLAGGGSITEPSAFITSRLHDGILWMCNDSNSAHFVHGVDYKNGLTYRKTLHMVGDGFTITDHSQMEDGAYDATTNSIWIANCGGNLNQITAYKFPEPSSLGDSGTALDVSVTRYRFQYGTSGETYNCEAMMCGPDGRVYFIPKHNNTGDGQDPAQTGLWQAPATLQSWPTANVLTKVATIGDGANPSFQIGAADWAPDNSFYAVVKCATQIATTVETITTKKFSTSSPWGWNGTFEMPVSHKANGDVGSQENGCFTPDSAAYLNAVETPGAEVWITRFAGVDPSVDAIAAASTITVPVNKCLNPDFEDNTSNWQGNGIGFDTSTISRSAEEAHSGNYSLKVVLPAPSTGYSGTMTPLGQVFAGFKYRVTGWVKIPTGTPDITPAIVYKYVGAPITVKDTWTSFTLDWVADADSSANFFGLYKGNGGYDSGDFFYTDDIYISKTTVVQGGAVALDMQAYPAIVEAAATIPTPSINQNISVTVYASTVTVPKSKTQYPDFEYQDPEGEYPVPDWIPGGFSADVPTLSRVNSPAHNGNWSMKVALPNKVNTYTAVTHPVAGVLGETYEMIGWAFVPNGSPDVLPTALYLDESGYITQKDQWVQFTYRYRNTYGTQNLFFGVLTRQDYDTSDSLYLDDVNVRRLPVTQPVITAGSTQSPAVVTATATVPTPTITAAIPANVSASVVARTASVPTPTIAATSVQSPAVVARVAAVPAPVIRADSKPAPSIVARVASVPAPTVVTGQSIQAITVTATASVIAPQAQAGAIATPAVVARSASVFTPSQTEQSATVYPLLVTVFATVPSATVQTASESNAPASTVQASATVPAPTITATVGATVTLSSPVQAAATVIAPAPIAGATASASVVARSAAVPTPTISASQAAGPATVLAAATVVPPFVIISTDAAASTIAATGTVPTPTTSASSAATPEVVTSTSAVSAAQASGSSQVSASTVTATGAVVAPSVATSGLATPSTVTASAAVDAADGQGGAVATPATVSAVASVPAVSVATVVEVSVLGAGAYATVPEVIVTATSNADIGVDPVEAFAQVQPVTIYNEQHQSISAATVTADSDVFTPTIEAGGSVDVQTLPVTATASVQSPSITSVYNSTVMPGTVTATASVPAAAPTVTVTIPANIVARNAGVPVPAITAYSIVAAAVVQATAEVPNVTILAGNAVNVSATVVTAAATVGGASIQASVDLTTGTITASTTVEDADVVAGVTLTMPPVVATSKVFTPAIYTTPAIQSLHLRASAGTLSARFLVGIRASFGRMGVRILADKTDQNHH